MANVERYSWNVQINGVVYLVEYMKGSVYINGGEAFKLRSLEYKRKFIPSRISYIVPLAGKELTLVIGQIDGVVLLMDGIDMSTGQQYQVPKLPGWVVVFYVLYIINIFVLASYVGAIIKKLKIPDINVALKVHKAIIFHLFFTASIISYILITCSSIYFSHFLFINIL